MTWRRLLPNRIATIETSHHKYTGPFDGPSVDVRNDETIDGSPCIVLEFFDPDSPRKGPVSRIVMDPDTAGWLVDTLGRAKRVAMDHFDEGDDDIDLDDGRDTDEDEEDEEDEEPPAGPAT